MTQKFTIPGRLDGLNSVTNANRTNKYAGARLKRENEDLVLSSILQAKLKPMTKPVFISFLWIEPNMKRDKDNIASAKKMVLDALVKGGIIKNDGWKDIVGFSDSFCIDKNNPRIEIELKETKNEI